MANILKALINIAKNPHQHLINHYKGRNTVNNMGEALEEYIKDAFADTINEMNPSRNIKLKSETFSWLGNQNNPPDAIIRNGDAIEVKKIEKYRTTTIALNSSYPKHKLYLDDPKITNDCRSCENWNVKDIIYSIGTVEAKKNILTHLWFIYGDCYAASREVYNKIIDTMEDGIRSIGGVEFSKTKELARVNRVDPLGITSLRIRGMWQIKNPSIVFEDIYSPENLENFQIVCLMRKNKFNLMPLEDREKIDDHKEFNIKNVKIKDPNNPANLLNAVLITYKKGN